jgi:CRP-like cAMP-binding protein
MRDLELSDLDRLAALAQPVEWHARQRIFREGDRDDQLYVVIEGRVAIDMSVPGREAVRILTVGPGELFGWSSVYHHQPKGAGATAVEETRALAFDAARLREWSDSDPRFGYWLARHLLQTVSERLKATRLQLLDVFGS